MQLKSSRFSPRLVDPEQLERLLVARHDFIQRIVEGVVSTVQEGGARFELLVGPRGSGKSHVLALILHRLRRDARMADVVMGSLDEEEHVSALLDLWARVLRSLPVETGLPDPGKQALSLRQTPGSAGEERAVKMLAERLGGRALVLALENLDRVFEALGPVGQKRLRATLQEQRRWTVVATTQVVTPDFHDRKRPFYRMFVEREIPPLTPEHCQEMLRRLARTHGLATLEQALATRGGLGRVQAIHHLVGGSPRAMACILPYLTTGTLEELEGAFLDLADELTPYYQEQIRARSAGQRALLEQMAESWRPLSVKELAEATFTSQGTTASQLRHLAADRLVSASTVGRERFYEIQDPLWRIVRAVKRPDAVGTVFIRFLRFWHTREEIEEKATGRADHCWLDALDRARSEKGGWGEEMERRMQAAFDEDNLDELLRLAETCYAKTPEAWTAVWLLWAYGLREETTRFCAFAEVALERFGWEVAYVPLAVSLLPGWMVPLPILERARDLLDLTPVENPVDRWMADEFLLVDGRSSEEVLTRCARRMAAQRFLPLTPMYYIALIRQFRGRLSTSELSHFLDAAPMAGISRMDRWNLAEILWSEGREDQALNILRGYSEKIRPTALLTFLLDRDPGRLKASVDGEPSLADLLESWWMLEDTPGAFQALSPQEPYAGLSRAIGAVHMFRLGRHADVVPLGVFLPLVPEESSPDPDLAEHLLFGSSPRQTGLAILLLSREFPVLHPAVDAWLPASDRGLAHTLVDLLQGAEPGPLPDRLPPASHVLLEGWLARLLLDEPRGPGAKSSMVRLLGASPSTDLVTALSTALWRLALSAAVHGQPKEKIPPLLSELDRAAPGQVPSAMVEAALALPEKLRPFARLAAEERKVFHQALARMGKAGQSLLERLRALEEPDRG